MAAFDHVEIPRVGDGLDFLDGAREDAQAGIGQHRHDCVDLLAVRWLARVEGQVDLRIRSGSGQIPHAVAVRVRQTQIVEHRVGLIKVIRIVDCRIVVVVRRAYRKASGIRIAERPSRDRLADCVAIQRMAERYSEILVPEQLPELGIDFVLDADRLGKVQFDFPRQNARPELGFRRRVLGLALLERFHVVAGILHVGKVAGARDRLRRSVGPSRQLEVHLVHVRELIAGFVDLPVVRVAAHDDDFVRYVLNRYPWSQHHRR